MRLRERKRTILDQSDRHSPPDPPQTGGEAPEYLAPTLLVGPALSLGTVELFGGCSSICEPGPIAGKRGKTGKRENGVGKRGQAYALRFRQPRPSRMVLLDAPLAG